MANWSPTSWKTHLDQQAIIYPDNQHLEDVCYQLNQLPALVDVEEVIQLKKSIALAGKGEAFILQGGDCAESFNDCRTEIIRNKMNILFEMSQILLKNVGKPIIQIGRIAGQYAKPRSSHYETLNGMTLPSYRGDLINLPAFNLTARTPNPNFLLQGYHCAALTLNDIRKILNEEMKKENFYTSHEALHLHYEAALTRRMPNNEGWYNLSTHMPWIGLRTAIKESAHIEFARGIQNPIGIKIGPCITPEWLSSLIALLNPKHEEGKILLIGRFGVNMIDTVLPKLIETTQKSKIPVTWISDPMHGNTEVTSDGIKTRHFDNILKELKTSFHIHRYLKSHLGGVHFELTGENVTECLGGSRGLSPEDLSRAYHSLVDPRLNYEQSLEMSVQLSQEFEKLRVETY